MFYPLIVRRNIAGGIRIDACRKQMSIMSTQEIRSSATYLDLVEHKGRSMRDLRQIPILAQGAKHRRWR